MKALLLPGERTVDLVDKEVREPRQGEVLVRMRAAGLCGSDLHMQYQPTADQRRGVIYGLQMNPDIVPGHEIAGEIAACGDDVHLNVGDRVTVHHMGGCGHCNACRRGWDINCENKHGTYGLDLDGAMADYMLARASDCVIVPDNVTMAEASYYACGAGTGYLALQRASFGVGDHVAVVGLGPVGIAAAYFAQRAGAVVVGFDTQPERCAWAQDRDLCHAVDARSETALDQLHDFTRGRGADVVVEASGRTPGRVLAMRAAALHGRVACVGFGDDLSEVPVQTGMIQKQVDLRGAWMFPLHQLERMLESVSAQNVSLAPLMNEEFTLDDAATAWARFDRGSFGKTSIVWS